MTGILKLSLEQANGSKVSLDNLSGEALTSFLQAVSHLKNIIKSQSDERKITYKIVEGSASVEALSAVGEIDVFYGKFRETLDKGNPNSEVIKEYKLLKECLSNDDLDFDFHYTLNGNKKEDLKERVISSRFKSKRDRSPWKHELAVKMGQLYLVGGTSPNYHLELGRNEKFTIHCSKEDAIEVNKDLYRNIKVLVEAKTKKSKAVDEKLTHKIILDSENAGIFKKFLTEYNKTNDLIEKLGLMHDFVFDNSNDKIKLLHLMKYLIIGFSSENFHQSELKTVLVISKAFKDDPFLSKERTKLFEIYNHKRN